MHLPFKSYWNLLAVHIRPQRGRFLLLLLLLFGSIGLRVASPQILRLFIDSAGQGETVLRLTLIGLSFLGLAILQQIVAVSVTYLGENVAWTATNALRAELAEHTLSLDMQFHNDHTPGELIERIDGDVSEMATFFSQFVITILGNSLLLIGIIVALFVEDWRPALAFTLFVIIAIAIINRVRNIALPEQKARRQAEAELFGFIEEQLAGKEDIRANRAEDYTLRSLHRLQTAIWRANRGAQFKRWIVESIFGSFLFIGNLMAFSSGYWLYTAGAVSLGAAYLFVHYINLLEEPLWSLTRQMETFQTIGACVERLSELRATPRRVADGSQPLAHTEAPELVFDDVSFSYNGNDAVLTHVSLRLAPGSVLGLLGRTGSGKTTLARLVFRLYDPTGGRILLQGQDLPTLQLGSLRNNVALVTQDVQIFHASVRDNLTFFDPAISDERIHKALDELGLLDWLSALPQGLNTLLGPGGQSLSAGEAQLLAFTRIFLHNPGLIILDEASSRLDPATEQRLERAIDRLLHQRTAIIIAHRLATVHRAETIAILDSGRVVEAGNRQYLAADPNSQFYHLLQTGLEEVLV